MFEDAARHWYERIMEVLKETGGKKSIVDGTIFTWKNMDKNVHAFGQFVSEKQTTSKEAY